MTLYEYSAELERVVDGDTYDFTVDLGFHVQKEVRVRMSGIDTAETYGVDKESEEYEQGMEHKRFVEEWFDEAVDIYVHTKKDEKGKYGRWIATVYNENRESLNVELMEEYPEVVIE